MKQETLEEAAEREASLFYEKGSLDWNKYRQVFIEGAKWKQKKDIKELKPNSFLIDEIGQWDFRRQERSYSEEEVNNLISDILYEVRYDYSNINIIENNIINIFEQFKK